MELKLLSWNVNGLRAVARKGFLDWLKREKPYLLALQETKASPQQLDKKILEVEGYFTYWSWPDKKGYSGVGVYTQEKPIKVYKEIGAAWLDREGRTLILEYPHFILFNLYFPNGKKSKERLEFKLSFYQQFLKALDKFKKKHKPLIVCGDFNTAHKEIDLARPKENSKVSGFLPQERAWLDKFIDWGLVDTFRVFNKEAGQYTWWDLKTRARLRNIGWRLDYFFIQKEYLPKLKKAFILKDVEGSDHCPVGIIFRI